MPIHGGAEVLKRCRYMEMQRSCRGAGAEVLRCSKVQWCRSADMDNGDAEMQWY